MLTTSRGRFYDTKKQVTKNIHGTKLRHLSRDQLSYLKNVESYVQMFIDLINNSHNYYRNSIIVIVDALKLGNSL